MADKVIHVNVTATKSQKVNVSAGNVQNQITATPDSSQYYSNLAKNWAISDKLVNNEDYSAKRYANLAKQDAERANTFTNSCLETYNNVIDYSAEAIDNIVETKNSAISDISESGHKAVTDIETEKQNTITEIQDITINNKEEIEKLSNQEQNKIISLGIESRANVDLSNLSATGEKHFLNKSQITNCITEIPQRVKLELANGVLTLKAGSTVIVPNGANVFDEVTISADKTRTWTYTRQGMMFYRYDTNVLYPVPLSQIHSGTTAPTGTLPSPTCWYDTTNNKVKITSDGGTTWIDTFSLPLCLLTANGTQITSIDQVFNGFGYIGSAVWVDKGVKGLIPNGRNEDGSLKNIEFVTNKVSTVSVGINQTNYSLVLNSDASYTLSQYQEVSTPVSGYVNYVSSENKIYNGVNQRFWAYIGSYSSDSNGKITSFNPKLPFRAVDYNDYINTPHITDPYVNGTSGYNVWSNGYCEQWGLTPAVSGGKTISVSLLKPYVNTNYNITLASYGSYTGSGEANDTVHTLTTSSFIIASGYIASQQKMWKTCGYIR